MSKFTQRAVQAALLFVCLWGGQTVFSATVDIDGKDFSFGGGAESWTIHLYVSDPDYTDKQGGLWFKGPTAYCGMYWYEKGGLPGIWYFSINGHDIGNVDPSGAESAGSFPLYGVGLSLGATTITGNAHFVDTGIPNSSYDFSGVVHRDILPPTNASITSVTGSAVNGVSSLQHIGTKWYIKPNANGTFTVNITGGSDTGSGIDYFNIFDNGQLAGTIDEDSTSIQINAGALLSEHVIRVSTTDHVGNTSSLSSSLLFDVINDSGDFPTASNFTLSNIQYKTIAQNSGANTDPATISATATLTVSNNGLLMALGAMSTGAVSGTISIGNQPLTSVTAGSVNTTAKTRSYSLVYNIPRGSVTGTSTYTLSFSLPNGTVVSVPTSTGVSYPGLYPSTLNASVPKITSLAWLNTDSSVTAPLYRLDTAVGAVGGTAGAYIQSSFVTTDGYSLRYQQADVPTTTGVITPTLPAGIGMQSQFSTGDVRYLFVPTTQANRLLLRNLGGVQTQTTYNTTGSPSFASANNTDFAAGYSLPANQTTFRNDFNVPLYLSSVSLSGSSTTTLTGVTTFPFTPPLTVTPTFDDVTTGNYIFAGTPGNLHVKFKVVQPWTSGAPTFANPVLLGQALLPASVSTPWIIVDTEGDAAKISVKKWIFQNGQEVDTDDIVLTDATKPEKSNLSINGDTYDVNLSSLYGLGANADGIYRFKLSLIENLKTTSTASEDIAGPAGNTQDFHVVVDTTKPAPVPARTSIYTSDSSARGLNTSDSYTNSLSVKLDIGALDATSGVKNVYIYNGSYAAAHPGAFNKNLVTAAFGSEQAPGLPATVPAEGFTDIDAAQYATGSVNPDTVIVLHLGTNQSGTVTPAYLNARIKNISWKLSGAVETGADTMLRTVYFVVEDQAGSLSDPQALQVRYDNTAPAAPALSTISRTISADLSSMSLSWDVATGDGIYASQVVVVDPADASKEIAFEATVSAAASQTTSFTQNDPNLIPLKTSQGAILYGPNKLVVKRIETLDYARNVSSQTIAFYSPAALAAVANGGQPSSIVAKKLPDDSFVYELTWTTSTAPVSGSLEFQKITVDSLQVNGTGPAVTESYSAIFAGSGVQTATVRIPSRTYPRSTINYRFSAVNSDFVDQDHSAFAVDSAPLSYAIANTAPLAPDIAGPVLRSDGKSYISANGVFSWSEPGDPEGDDISYHLLITSAGIANGSEFDVSPQGLNAGMTGEGSNAVSMSELRAANAGNPAVFTALDYLSTDGSSFSWRVQSVDAFSQQAGVSGTRTTVTDTVAPDVRLTGLSHGDSVIAGANRLFDIAVQETGGRIAYTAADNSIQEGLISWSLTDRNGNTVSSGGTIGLSPGQDANHSKASLILSGQNSGEYTLRVSASDWAGNQTELPQKIIVDADPPQFLSLALQTMGNAFVASANTVYPKISGKDDLTGISTVEYAFVNANTQSALQNAIWKSVDGPGWTTDTVTTVKPFDTSTLTDGFTGYIAIRLSDQAQNTSAPWISTKQFIKDRRAPAADLELSAASGAIRYLKNLSGFANGNLSVITRWNNTAMQGLNSNTVSVQYGLSQTGESLPDNWYATSAALAAENPVAGKSYEIAAKLTSPTGVVSYARSPSFIVDDRSPSSAEVWQLSGTLLSAGASTTVSVHIGTQGSPIRKVLLWLESESNQIVAVSPVTGAVNNKFSQNDSDLISLIFPIPAALTEGDYHFAVEAIDAVGNDVIFRPGAASVSVTTGDYVSVADSGPYVSDSGKVRASWTVKSSSTVAAWSYRLRQNLTVVSDWQAGAVADRDLTIDLSAQGTSLNEGPLYSVDVAIELADGRTLTGTGGGFRVDKTPPSFNLGQMSAPAFTHSAVLNLGWGADDPQSGIGRIRAQLREPQLDAQGNETGMIPVSDWIQVPAQTSVSQYAVSFTLNNQAVDLSGRHRLAVFVEASNRAGLLVEANAGVVIADTSAPPKPYVSDTGTFFNPAVHGEHNEFSGEDFTGTWAWTVPDPESGSNFEWTLLSDPSQAQNPSALTWHDAAGQLSVARSETQIISDLPDLQGTSALSTGTVVYLAVRSTNGSGLSSIGLSDGQVVDVTAPSSPKITLTYATPPGGQSPGPYDFMNPTISDLNVSIVASDIGSGIENIAVESGTIDTSTGVFTQLGSTAVLAGSDTQADGSYLSTIDKSLIQNLSEGTILGVRARIVDATGNTRVVLTPGVYLEREVAALASVYAHGNQAAIDASWVPSANTASLAGFDVSLVRSDESGPVLSHFQLGASARGFRYQPLNTQGLVDGHYQVKVKAISRSGLQSAVLESNVTVLDTTAPVFGATTKIAKFADMSADVLLDAHDDLSRIDEYQYSLGSNTNPLAYQDDWTSVTSTQSGSTVVNTALPFIYLKSIPDHLTNLYLYYRSRNSSGLWTDLTISPRILVDHTKPAGLSAVSPPYGKDKNEVRGNSLAATDAESGLTSLRYLMVEQGTQFANLEGVSNVATVAVSPTDISQDGVLSLPGFTTGTIPGLTEDHFYRLAFQVRNGAGTWSDVAYGTVMQVDTTPPFLNFTGSGIEIVTNDGHVGSGPLSYIMSDDVTSIDFIVTGPDGNPQTVTYTKNGQQAFHPAFSFDRTDPARYAVKTKITDKAGYQVETQDGNGNLLTVRVNMAPVFNAEGFGDMATTPGRPDSITVKKFFDPDGDDAHMTVVAVFEDGQTQSVQWTKPASGTPEDFVSTADIIHAFMQRPTQTDPYPQVSTHLVGFYLVDANGKESPRTVAMTVTGLLGIQSTVMVTELRTLTVYNTSAGPLYANEFWGQFHRVQGNITVPAGIVLTVLPNTEVQIRADSNQSTDFGVAVEGGIVINPSTLFDTELPTQMWNGIEVEPGATITANGTRIVRADRAITLADGGGGTINGLTVAYGNIGVHLIAGQLTILGGDFIDTWEYGVKAEVGAQAFIKNSRFENTPYAYYDPATGNALGAIELNSLPGSSGNTAEGQ